MTPETAALSFLSELELIESALLSWGVVDGSFDAEELRERATNFIISLFRENRSGGFSSVDDLLKWLEERKLLWAMPSDNLDESPRYRTRMAETVRLLSRLRQLFDERRWRDAPNLVADYRLLLRSRAFPKPKYKAEEAVTRLASELQISTSGLAAIKAVLRVGSDKPLELREFQHEATLRVLGRIRESRSTGTIVCAGTGSGKTLSFYLPAFAVVAANKNDTPWTKCLALYPRNELLKDQLREALGQARRIKPSLPKPISIGVLYGDVPHNSKQLLTNATDPGNWLSVWKKKGNDFICPLFNCPVCGKQLVWAHDDIKKKNERLQCENAACDVKFEPSEIRLTRERLQKEPPDILFTSLEMMNQRMSSDSGTLFGVGIENKPLLVLLDEVHTYEGMHGAQVALLLRRWRKLSGAQPHFVGLSATLEDASRFFADIVGLLPAQVKEIKPKEEELSHEGMEYMIALRGDPVSATSLLSTSIQTLMLLRRILQPKAKPDYPYLGSKVFAFTDNLDVVNRLYFNLIDSERWQANGKPAATPALATFRAKAHPQHSARLAQGQSWDLVEWIGHSLGVHAREKVGRTSSQDSGVDKNVDIIVATASLEVGFDDPEVGAVLQHKAPLNDAAFLQRKGRAGRRREMRPWTAVVLSDYGRDRLAYQGYEQMFSPQLKPKYLPTGNRHVLRMQATYTLLDWLFLRLSSLRGLDLWKDLSAPAEVLVKGNQYYEEETRERQKKIEDLLKKLLGESRTREDFKRYLSHALQVSTVVADSLLWDAPRAILTAVIPTALRRLEQQWVRAGSKSIPPQREFFVKGAPLHEFIPRALFSDLNLPEVQIIVPPSKESSMAIRQALSEFAPGRVTQRFSIQSWKHRHWVPVPIKKKFDTISIDVYGDARWQELGTFQFLDNNTIVDVQTLRPFQIEAAEPPPEVASSSNSFLQWKTQLIPLSGGLEVELPKNSPWASLIKAFFFFLHERNEAIEARRFATGANSSLVLEKNRERERCENSARFTRKEDDENVFVAVGFTLDVDAFSVRLSLPDEPLWQRLQRNEPLARGLRPALFKQRIFNDTTLDGIANRFQRGWLCEVYLSALFCEAIQKGTPLSEVASNIREGRASLKPGSVIEVIFQSLSVGSSEEGELETGTRGQELNTLLSVPEVQKALHEAAVCLWQPIDALWEPWLRGRFKATLGNALLETGCLLCSNMDVGDLIVDIEPGPRHGVNPQLNEEEVWLSEVMVGGASFIEELRLRYTEDPRRFFSVLESVLRPSDFEEVDTQLRRLLRLASPNSPEYDPIIGDALVEVRKTASHKKHLEKFKVLYQHLDKRGFVLCHPVLVAIAARILRPGSSENTDRLLFDILERWEVAEKQLGVEIDARVIAFISSQNEDLDEALAHIDDLPPDAEMPYWRFSALYGLLWPRGASLRAEALKSYNPYTELPPSDRQLLLLALPNTRPRISIDAPDWFSSLSVALAKYGVVGLEGKTSQPEKLQEALFQVTVRPIDMDLLLVYPRLRGVERDADCLLFVLDVQEAVQ